MTLDPKVPERLEWLQSSQSTYAVRAVLAALLRSLKACAEARAWAEPYDKLQAAWDVCPRGDWMIWLLEAANVHAPERHTFAYACTDRAVRVNAVAALRSAGLTEQADTLAALAPVTDKETADAARSASVSASHSAARSAAHWAADSSAESAAHSAYSAACSAACSAERSAERQWQADALRRLVPTPEVGR